ncbi:MAG: AsmA family protein [Nitrococcus sp.]|nr:AsmA family protein [Nitrococcus sp.]
MSRPGKILFGIVGTVAVIVIILFVVLFLTLDRSLKYAVEEYGPSVTGTPVNLDEVKLALFSGNAELHGLKIGNPEGFESPYAFKLGDLKVNLVPESLASDTIVVKELVVGGASLNAEFDGMKSNLKQILDNVKQSAGSSGQEQQPAPEAGTGKPKKFIVQEFRFTGGEVSVLSDVANVKQTASIPGFAIHDIGSAEGGVTVAELTKVLLQPIINKAIEQAKAKALQQASEQIKEKVQEKVQDKVGETLKGLMQ